MLASFSANAERDCIKTKIFLGIKTRSGVTQDQPNFEPEKAVQVSSRKRQRTSFDLSQSRKPAKGGKRVHRTTEHFEKALVLRDDRIRSLEEENKALKKDNKGLKKQILKEFDTPICTRSYNRSDGLYTHLQKGDEEHRRLAWERYENTKCKICGKACTRWGDLKKHMAIHEQKVVGSAGELNLEPDARACLRLLALSNRVDINILICSCVTFPESVFGCSHGSRDCVEHNKRVSTLTLLKSRWWRLTQLEL